MAPDDEPPLQARIATSRINQKPQIAHRCTAAKPVPVPRPQNRPPFIVGKPEALQLQVAQGRFASGVPSKANRWIHVLLPVLLAALRTLGDAPAHSLPALAQRLDVSEVDAAMVVAPPEEAPPPLATAPTTGPASPLCL